MDAPLLSPIPADRPPGAGDETVSRRIRLALLADPALTGRVGVDPAGTVVLTGPGGGPPPASQKERRRWELHVRLRLEAQLGESAAARAIVRWSSPGVMHN